MARILSTLGVLALTVAFFGVQGSSVGASDSPGSGGTMKPGAREPRRIVLVAKKKPKAKKTAPKKGDGKDADTPAPAATTPAGDGAELKFSKDIAPIFVNNCINCHNPKDKDRRGKLDLTSFEKIMKGTPKEKIIEPGDPEASHLVLRLRGEEQPAMPMGGGNRTLSEEAIERIEKWIKAGARLDAGIDRNASIETYALSPEQLRIANLAKMKPAEVDKLVENAGLERWKKASPKSKPQVTPGKNFTVFSTMPKGRVDATLKAMDRQYEQMKRLVGAAPLAWGEKASIFVFNDRNSFVEFARTIESREVEAEEQGTVNLNVAEPYIAVLDPYHGGEEPTAAPKRARTKKDDGGAPATNRSVAGLSTEQFVIGTLARAGKPPRWLSLGMGAFYASRIEGQNPYYRTLRSTARDLFDQGWAPKAQDALGGQLKTEETRAVGFAIIEWLSTGQQYFGPFVNGMLGGQEKLDDAIGQVFNGTRESFLGETGNFIEANYGRR